MHRLGEQQDDASFLEPGVVAEGRTKSTDYDVFRCGHCIRTLVAEFKNFDTEVTRCPPS